MTMSCEQAEALLAEALGDEISASDNERLAKHLRDCAACRDEFAALRQTVGVVRRRFGDREDAGTLIPPKPRIEGAAWTTSVSASTSSESVSTAGPIWWRYAAIIVISFGLGYLVRAQTGTDVSSSPVVDHSPNVAQSESPPRNDTKSPSPRSKPRETLRDRLLAAHRADPNASNLAKSLVAILGDRGS